MNNINDVRRIFLFAVAVYLVLAIPRLHAMQPQASHLHGPSIDDVISGLKVSMTRLGEAQQTSSVFFPGS